jgi:hypothetical protein
MPAKAITKAPPETQKQFFTMRTPFATESLTLRQGK